MYVYKVTNKTTGEYYFGYTTENKYSFKPGLNPDPHNLFEATTHNGAREVPNTHKELVSLAFSVEELQIKAEKAAMACKHDKLCKGAKHLQKKTHQAPQPQKIEPKSESVVQPKKTKNSGSIDTLE
jgi:hypothetical protein